MKSLIKIFLFLIAVTFFNNCNTTEPPPPNGDKPTLELNLEDISCTEAWIALTTTNFTLPAELVLKQINPTGDTLSQVSILNTQDSLLYVDSLLPNKNYQYQVSSIEHPATSNEITVATMDTTSHNFTFETFTFGGTAGTSTLYDVAIINENNIWAVGDIKIADTSQNGYTMYNAVHWDGIEWELMRIPFLYQGDSLYGTIYAVFAFSMNDIWFGIGSIIHWDGERFRSISTASFFPSIINKIWGSSSDDLFIVGNDGNIARYNGTIWQRIESGTDVNINDVFGVIDQKTNQRKVFCAASFVLQLGEHKILTIDENNNVDSMHWNTGRRVNSIWSNNGRIVYTSGGGVFNNKTSSWEEERSIPLYYTNRIRGNGLNDIFAVGDFALLAHFNGTDWRIYQDLLQLPLTSFNSITVKENIISIVGYSGEKALVIIGNRN